MKRTIKVDGNIYDCDDQEFEGLCHGCYTEKTDVFFFRVNSRYKFCLKCFNLILEDKPFPKTTRKGEEIEVEEIIV